MNEGHGDKTNGAAPAGDPSGLSEERKILEQLESDGRRESSSPAVSQGEDAPVEVADQRGDDPASLLTDTMKTLRRLIDEVRAALEDNRTQEGNTHEEAAGRQE